MTERSNPGCANMKNNDHEASDDAGEVQSSTQFFSHCSFRDPVTPHSLAA
ncbi:hypothetical protein [Pseudomonas sp. MF6747]